jgi:hypothetical protein
MENETGNRCNIINLVFFDIACNNNRSLQYADYKLP